MLLQFQVGKYCYVNDKLGNVCVSKNKSLYAAILGKYLEKILVFKLALKLCCSSKFMSNVLFID